MSDPLKSKEFSDSIFSALREALIGEMLSDKPTLVLIPLPKFPNWDGKLYARLLSPEEIFHCEEVFRSVEYKLLHPVSMAKAIVLGVADAEGKPVFCDKDMEPIKKKGCGMFFEQLGRAVMRVNGFIETELDKKAIVGNSNETSGSATGSGSPVTSSVP